MVLRGDVQSLNLASVLQHLAADQKTGTLVLSQKDRRIHLWFEKGAVRLVGLGKSEGPSILNGLLALGRITHDDLPDTTTSSRGEAGMLRRVVKKLALPREEIRSALAHQMNEHLCEAFLWKDAHYEFLDGDPDDESFDVSQLDHDVRLAVDALILEALRRLDEWQETRKAIVPAGDILVPDPSRLPADTDETVRRILPFIDGERTVRDLMDLTRLGPFTVYKAVAALMRTGAARPLLVAEALSRAQEHGKNGRWDPALRLALYGLDREPNNHALREFAAGCYESLDKPREAIAQFRRLAAAQLDEGQPEPALETYQKIVVLAPGDLHAHERVFGIFLTLGRKEEALQAAEGFAQAAKKAGLPDKVRDIYAKLMEAFGEDEKLLESLAELERYLGDRIEAAELYAKILRLAMKRGDDASALDCCRTILRLDPKREDVRQIRERLESGALVRQRARRRFVRISFVLLLILAVLGFFGQRELRARWTLTDLRKKIVEATLAGRSSDALRHYDGFLNEWSTTLIAREVRPERDQIAGPYMAGLLEESAKREAAGDIPEAIRAAEEAVEFAPRKDLDLARQRLRTLEAARDSEVEKRRTEIQRLAFEIREGRGVPQQAQEKLSTIRDPFAVPALRECLRDGSLVVRRASVEALGAIEGESPLLALIDALGDLAPELRTLASGHLTRRTGQDFGTDQRAWQAWILRQDRRTPETPMLQASLVPLRTRIQPDDPAPVEWRVQNIGAAPVEISLPGPGNGISVYGPDRKPRPVTLPENEPRKLRLAPGEFVGGILEMRRLCPEMSSAGAYRVEWRIPLQADGMPKTLEAAAVVLEAVP